MGDYNRYEAQLALFGCIECSDGCCEMCSCCCTSTSSPRARHCSAFLLVIISALSAAAAFIQKSNVHQGIDLGAERVVYPLWTGVWMAFLISGYAFTQVCMIYLDVHPALAKLCCARCKGCGLAFFRYFNVVMAVFAVFLIMGWGLGRRYDGVAWGGLFFLTAIICICSDRVMERLHKHEDGESDEASGDYVSFHPGSNYDRRPSRSVANPFVDHEFLSGAPSEHGNYRSESGPSVLWLVLHTLLQLFFSGVHIVMLAAVIILLGGAYVQGVGYGILYQPDGQFIKVTYPSGYTHHVLAQCVGPLNTTLPVVWVEVGGGGHSTSDLWGLRDYIVLNYPQVRYCAYDFPGTGWSDPMLAQQPSITQQLMTALHVDGPVVCVGNMDHADERCLLFCSANPKKCKAVVPVGFTLLNEFQQIAAFFNQSRDEVNAIAKSTIVKRLSLCDQYSAWQSVSGLIAAQVPDAPWYIPQARATEFHFLNLMNEKQWMTNCRMLQLMLEDPAGTIGSVTPWANASIPLDAPVWAFIAGDTLGNLDYQCQSMELALNSPECQFIHFQYTSTLAGNMAVVARNPQSKLFMCGGNATGPQAGSNATCINMNGSFFVDQFANIPWFAQTLISAMQSL